MPRRILALVTDTYGAGVGIAQYNRDLFAALAGSGQVEESLVLLLATKARSALIWNTAFNLIRNLLQRFSGRV